MKRLFKPALDNPSLYLAFQRAYGADRLRRMCTEMLAAKSGERILDVGCGPAYLLDYLPDVDYVGFDTEPRYLAHARARFGSRGTFILSRYTDEQCRTLTPFDGILLMGLLHHLDDREASELLCRLARSLRPGGRVVTLDPCFTPDQSRIARFMAANDRGRHVRHPQGYADLVGTYFQGVQVRVVHNVCRVPSTEIIHVLRGPRAAARDAGGDHES